MSKLDVLKMNKTVKKINLLKESMALLSDGGLKRKTLELKERIKTESLDKLLPEAFALVREATKRALGKEHYDVQLLAGIVLYQGKIAEAKTGEGKTITIYLPAFLAALEGKGVHVVTVNDYLANRDATDAKAVFSKLGISVGCILNNSTQFERKLAYLCDITYVTNSELGFDYLRDHIMFDKMETVLRGFNYAIIDEIDSILIDEAKTPLIISGPGENVADFLQDVDDAVRKLKLGTATEVSKLDKLMGEENTETGDFIKNEKDNQIYLTESGISKIEKLLKIENYGDISNIMTQRAVNNSLRANYMMSKDKDYIVKDGKVEIIDYFTGRVLPGRRFSDGLHQALEAKELLEIQRENITTATITFQSFFNKYKKKSGLTGTAMTSEKEFKSVYNLDVVEIPTNKPIARKDLNDLVFETKEDKWNAVLKAVKETHMTGQPVLIGTSSIEDSEIVSALLEKNNIPHNTLNAKNEALEAEIISHAGEVGAVTVATNMAGRGTDIILDDKSKKLGGLKVIGTERHDSRRIDNQLKGRAGRQGDPGTSQFFISLEDKLMRVFADQGSLQLLMSMSNPGEPLEYKPLTKIIQKAQQAVETEHRLVRENMLKYDVTNNEHREEIYSQREEILESDNARQLLEDMFSDVIDDLVDKHIPDDMPNSEWNLPSILNDFYKQVKFVSFQIDISNMKKEDLKNILKEICSKLIDAKEKEVEDPIIMNSVERSVLLRMLDRNWVGFLSSMEYLKTNIGHQAYAQKDPAVEYKKKGVIVFNKMIDNIKKDTLKNFMNCSINVGAAQKLQETKNKELAELKTAKDEMLRV